MKLADCAVTIETSTSPNGRVHAIVCCTCGRLDHKLQGPNRHAVATTADVISRAHLTLTSA